MGLVVFILFLVASQGHLGDGPFEAGSWAKAHFAAQASPWQPALRGSLGRVNVSAALLKFTHVEIQGHTDLTFIFLTDVGQGLRLCSTMLLRLYLQLKSFFQGTMK
jgi:hypothetical protein